MTEPQLLQSLTDLRSDTIHFYWISAVSRRWMRSCADNMANNGIIAMQQRTKQTALHVLNALLPFMPCHRRFSLAHSTTLADFDHPTNAMKEKVVNRDNMCTILHDITVLFAQIDNLTKFSENYITFEDKQPLSNAPLQNKAVKLNEPKHFYIECFNWWWN